MTSRLPDTGIDFYEEQARQRQGRYHSWGAPGSWVNRGLRRAMVQWCHRLPKGARVLDIGCGRGQLARELTRFRPDLRIIGMDPSQAMLRLGQGQGDIHWVRARAEEIPFRRGTIDAVLALNVTHHLGGQTAMKRLVDGLSKLCPSWILWEIKDPRWLKRQMDMKKTGGAAAAGVLLGDVGKRTEQPPVYAHDPMVLAESFDLQERIPPWPFFPAPSHVWVWTADQALRTRQEIWDKVGEEHQGQYVPARSLPGLLNKVMRRSITSWAKTLGSGSTVLDLGCGDGRLGRDLRQSRPDLKVVGMDFSRSMLKSSNFPQGVMRVQGSADRLPFKNLTADVVILLNVMNVLNPKEARAALDEAGRVSGQWILVEMRTPWLLKGSLAWHRRWQRSSWLRDLDRFIHGVSRGPGGSGSVRIHVQDTGWPKGWKREAVLGPRLGPLSPSLIHVLKKAVTSS